jgi:uncharacterized membrane protein
LPKVSVSLASRVLRRRFALGEDDDDGYPKSDLE